MNFIGGIFGYIIWFGYNITGSYTVGLLLFTLVVKLLLLPFSIKQQKTTARQMRLAPKLQEIKEKYANNPTKQQEETRDLYAKENISMSGGCLTTLIQFPIIIALYQAVVNPLTNVLHLASDKVNAAITGLNITGGYQQHNLVNNFTTADFAKYFDSAEIAQIEGMKNGGFTLFGMNLLDIPTFTSLLVLIPVLCLLSSLAMSLFMNRKQSDAMAAGGGCMKWGMPIFMAAFSTYLSFVVPGALGVYWILSNIFSIIQMHVLYKCINMYTINARDEAGRLARRRIEEKAVMASYGDVDIRAVAATLQPGEEEKDVPEKKNKKKK